MSENWHSINRDKLKFNGYSYSLGTSPNCERFIRCLAYKKKKGELKGVCRFKDTDKCVCVRNGRTHIKKIDIGVKIKNG